jgi:hypothetical protein
MNKLANRKNEREREKKRDLIKVTRKNVEKRDLHCGWCCRTEEVSVEGVFLDRNSYTFAVNLRACVCVCYTEREREREREI